MRPPRRSVALLEFLRVESAGGSALILSGVVAMIWANSCFGAAYFALLNTNIGSHNVRFWVNDGLMAAFFLQVGLELRREINQGELASPSRLAAPVIAALGGMVAPAIVFSLFNYQDHIAMRGWAVPVATDIAFALAVLGVLRRRVPFGLTIFLMALAIIDDLGAIVVIALFYSQTVQVGALVGAAVLIVALWGLNRSGVKALPIYVLGGVLLWLLVLRSGVHATLSGVALAFVTPAMSDGPGARSPALRLERALDPLIAYMILPVFGLANAGLRLDGLPNGVLTEPLFLGTMLALVVGKPVGVFSAVMVAVRLKLATLPEVITRLQLGGAAMVCGIGFTMSLFIGDLAFSGSSRQDEVKLAVFCGSLLSAFAGLIVIAAGSRPAR